jgi:hypothetical protein
MLKGVEDLSIIRVDLNQVDINSDFLFREIVRAQTNDGELICIVEKPITIKNWNNVFGAVKRKVQFKVEVYFFIYTFKLNWILKCCKIVGPLKSCYWCYLIRNIKTIVVTLKVVI